MKILFVGPGTIEIPSSGWGAVETVIWQLKIHLESLGHKVDILNKKGVLKAIKAKPWTYDLVHLQYDDYAWIWNRLSKFFSFKLVVTNHYGYAAWPDKWYSGYFGLRGYKRIFKNLLKSPALIVLSPEIKKLFLDRGYTGFIETLPNGTEVDAINFLDNPTKDLLCLGKIEPRKRQADLSKIISSYPDVKIDFVGPIVDNNFSANGLNTHYLGTWTREEVRSKLTQYKCLILLSDGEAHALVVGEALAAGLSLIISKESSANLDPSLPFIKIVNIEDGEAKIVNCIKNSLKDNPGLRYNIRNYSKGFDWKNTANSYIMIMKNYLEKSKK